MARSSPPAHTIERIGQVRALASGARQELVDTLQVLGTASIAELAQQMGRPADGLYYHVRALLKSGLLVAAGTRRSGAREETLYRTVAPRANLRLRYRTEHAPSRRALQDVVGSMLRSAAKDFHAGLERAGVRAEGEDRELWAARGKGWFTRQELKQVNALLSRLVAMRTDSRRRTDAALYSLSFVLAPAAARAADRRSDSGK